MFEIILFIGVVVFIWFIIWANEANKDNEINKRGFKFAKKFSNMDDRVFGAESSLYFSDEKEEILVVAQEKSEENASFRVLNYKDILEVEVIEDGDSITKTSRMSQAGGMLIGGIVLGGVGAVVGGLSGSTKTINKVSTIDIKILINNKENPLYVFNVMTIKDGVAKKSSVYTNNKNNADKVHAILKVIIQEMDSKDQG